VLEAVVEFLARRRATSVAAEEAVDGLSDPPYPKGISKPFDVVVKDGPCELHECRTRVGIIDQSDIDVFEAASAALATAFDDIRCTFVTLESRASLALHVRRFVCTRPVYGVGIEDSPVLATTYATEVVAPPRTT
jgi:hypothetical protein